MKGKPRLQRRLWWRSSARGQLTLLCKELLGHVINDFETGEVRCILGNLEIVAPDDITVEIYVNGVLKKDIQGFPIKVYREGETIIIETPEKRIRVKAKQ